MIAEFIMTCPECGAIFTPPWWPNHHDQCPARPHVRCEHCGTDARAQN